MRFGVARRPDPLIDLTPMIDIIFQLVLFFMVSTTFVQAPGFEVDLPRSSAEAVISDNKDLNIWMTTDGSVYVDETPVNTQELRRILQNRGKSNPKTMVIIKADTGVPHGRVVGVMDMARAEGLTRLAIATDPGAEDGSAR